MIYIEKDNLVTDDFVVVDEDDNPVIGLVISDFTIKLRDPDKNEVSSGISIDEIGNGIYRISFTPDTLGNWSLIVYNSTYFPWGKGENYIALETLGGGMLDFVKRILGLCQENYRIFNPIYDRKNNLVGGTIKIYSTAADVETDTNIIATYQIIASFNMKSNLMDSYKVKKIS